ncbi:MAG: 50S ribosomal protein L9 [Gemmatimonadota bacterium]
MVELILKQDVESLGLAGEIVDVKPGFARNYLLPQGMALEATAANMRQLTRERSSLEERRTRAANEAQALSESIQGVSLEFAVKAGDEGKLFGSVTAGDIAAALGEKGVEIDRQVVKLGEPIKQLGEYDVSIRLHAEVIPVVHVSVVAED